MKLFKKKVINTRNLLEKKGKRKIFICTTCSFIYRTKEIGKEKKIMDLVKFKGAKN